MQAKTLEIGAQFLGDVEEKWGVRLLFFANDMVLVADSKRKLERLVEEFGRVVREGD